MRSPVLLVLAPVLLVACSGPSASAPGATSAPNDAGSTTSGDASAAAQDSSGPTGLTDSAAPGADASAGGVDAAPALDAAKPPTFTQITLGFDDVATGTAITTQYAAHATVSSDPGCACQTSANAGLASSPPNYLFTYYSCATGPTASVFVDFARPVHALSFKGIGVNDTGKVATIQIVTASGTQTVDLIGKGDYSTPVAVDLSAYDGVTRLAIVNVTDAYGMGFDDVSFAFPE